MSIKRLFLICIVFTVATKGFAELKITNNSNEDVFVAIGYFENDEWYSEGWWEVKNGETVMVRSDFTNRYYYYYAKGTTLEWKGDSVFFHIHPTNRFKFQRSITNSDKEIKYVGFTEIDFGDNTTFNLQLRPPSNSVAGRPRPPHILMAPAD